MPTQNPERPDPRIAPFAWIGEGIGRLAMPIRAKLLIAFLGIAVLMVGLALLGLATLRAANDRTARLAAQQAQFAVYRDVNSVLNELLASTYSEFSGGVSSLSAPVDQIRSYYTYILIDLNGARVAERRKSNPDTVYVARLDELMEGISQLNKTYTKLTVLTRAGDDAGAQAYFEREIVPVIRRVQRAAVTYSVETEEAMQASAAANDLAYRANQRTVLVASATAVLLALLLGYSISTSIIRPMDRIRATLRRVASGDFSARVRVANRDELGDLARSANTMTERLGALYDDLESANRHKSQFLANMSHELRTPMNSILGYTELIRDGIYGEVPEKIDEALERVDANGKALLALINDVLDISKIEAGGVALQIEPYDPGAIAADVMNSMRPMAAEKGLALHSEIAASLPEGRGDGARIRQVVLNVVGNAVKFTTQGSVSIAVDAVDESYRITVTDTGPGIADSEQAAVFDEFRQADASSTREAGGTGLGLAISRKLARMHGGDITLKSEPGRGSCFTITLPVEAQSREEAA